MILSFLFGDAKNIYDELLSQM